MWRRDVKESGGCGGGGPWRDVREGVEDGYRGGM